MQMNYEYHFRNGSLNAENGLANLFGSLVLVYCFLLLTQRTRNETREMASGELTVRWSNLVRLFIYLFIFPLISNRNPWKMAPF